MGLHSGTDQSQESKMRGSPIVMCRKQYKPTHTLAHACVHTLAHTHTAPGLTTYVLWTTGEGAVTNHQVVSIVTRRNLALTDGQIAL